MKSAALSVDRIAYDTWLITDHAELNCIGWLLPAGEQFQLIIAEFDYGHYRDVKSRLICYAVEVYSTFFWAVQPEDTADLIIHHYSLSLSPLFPVDLVYEYGGTVKNKEIRVAISQSIH